MGSCCFQSSKPQPQKSSKDLEEKLMQPAEEKQPQRKTVSFQEPPQKSIETFMKKYVSIEQNIPKPLQKPKEARFKNDNLDKMSEVDTVQQKRSYERSDQLPNQSTLSIFRSGLKLTEDNIKTNQKSELWLQQPGSKIFYNNYQKQQEMLFTFKINKFKIDDVHPMNYLLHPSEHQHKHKFKNQDLCVCLITSPKSISSYKSVLPLLKIDNHIKPIFGLHKPENQKLPKSYFETDKIYEVINMGKSTVRMEAIDQIIFSLREEKYFDKILQFCQKVTQHFDLQDLTKITFILPSFLTLSQISTILSKLFRKHLISQKLESILKYLGYHILLLESASQQFQEVIILSSNLSIYQQEQMINRQFEVKLELAMGLLMIEIDNSNFKIYESVMMNFIMDKNIIDYLKFIMFVHKDKKEYIRQIQELKLFEEEQLSVIQRSKKIEQVIIGQFQKSITIPHKNKRKIGELFREYKTSKTPVEQPEKKKQWDDDLKENDIAATIMEKSSKNLSRHQSFEANLFEIINDEELEKIDLALLPNEEEEFQFQQN